MAKKKKSRGQSPAGLRQKDNHTRKGENKKKKNNEEED